MAHAPEAARATPPGPVGLAARVDDLVYALECALVTAALLVMTATLGLDIVYRSFASGDSQLGAKLATVVGWVAGEPSPSTRAFLEDRVGPALLVLATIGVGAGLYASVRRRQGRAISRAGALAAGLGTLVVGVAFVELVLRVPSRFVCALILLSGSAWAVVSALRQRALARAVLVVVIAVVGTLWCLRLRKNYIWSQELSLILLAWVAFLGASMATRAQKHIFVDALAKAVPRRIAPWARAIGLALTAGFCVYVCSLAALQIFGARGDLAGGELRPATGIPAWTITAATLTAFGLMAVRFGAHALDAFVHPALPEEALPS